jgi:hypothetical protein
MKLLVFCGTKAAIRAFADCEGWLTIDGADDDKTRRSTLRKFMFSASNNLATGAGMAVGWRAPRGTRVLFDATWPYAMNDPHTIQAMARIPADGVI